MEKIFKDVLNQLIILNSFLDKKALTESDLIEEKENYDDFLKELKELRGLLEVYKSTPINDIYAGSRNIVELHTLMDSLSWYVKSLHNRVIDVLKHSPMVDDI